MSSLTPFCSKAGASTYVCLLHVTLGHQDHSGPQAECRCTAVEMPLGDSSKPAKLQRKIFGSVSYMNAPLPSFAVRTCPKMHLSLENGQAHVRAIERVPVEGTWVEYRCNPGFHLVGSPRSNCTKVGRWSSSKPVCECK